MKRFVLFALASLWLGVAGAQTPAGRNYLAARSVSGEFLVYVSEGKVRTSVIPDANHIVLVPDLLAVSGERIKQALADRLGMADSARTRIRMELRTAVSPDEQITILSERFRDGWGYWVGLPDVVDRGTFVRAMVRVLLLEAVNRNGGSRVAELPDWLYEGLSEELLETKELALILPPATTRVARGLMITRVTMNELRTNSLSQAWQTLHTRAPLTFEELSWPTDAQMSGEAADVFRGSAQLFVTQLLRLRGGQACLRKFLTELPQHYNWQIAFFSGFKSYFPGQLDVEKWWALQVVRFTGRDLAHTWPLDESWTKLDQIIRSPVQVRTGEHELPLQSEVTLQTLIARWDGVQQAYVLRQKRQELEMLRRQVAQELIPLVDDYRSLIGAHLEKLGASGMAVLVGNKVKRVSNRVAEETIQQLDALDLRRENLRPKPAKPVAVAAPVAR